MNLDRTEVELLVELVREFRAGMISGIIVGSDWDPADVLHLENKLTDELREL
jgi:hypothetical protein